MVIRFMFALVLVATTAGCAALSGAPATAVKTACSYDQAWAAALASVDELTLRHTDEAQGVIATEWRTMDSDQKAGLFGREGKRERARFFLNLEPGRQNVIISVRQVREYFSPMGVQSQSTRWRRIPPLAEEEQRLVQQLANRLQDKGCTILR